MTIIIVQIVIIRVSVITMIWDTYIVRWLIISH